MASNFLLFLNFCKSDGLQFRCSILALASYDFLGKKNSYVYDIKYKLCKYIHTWPKCFLIISTHKKGKIHIDNFSWPSFLILGDNARPPQLVINSWSKGSLQNYQRLYVWCAFLLTQDYSGHLYRLVKVG